MNSTHGHGSFLTCCLIAVTSYIQTACVLAKIHVQYIFYGYVENYICIYDAVFTITLCLLCPASLSNLKLI